MSSDLLAPPATETATFPIPLDTFKKLPLDPKNTTLTAEQRDALKHNIQLCRDAIVFFTAIGDAKGLGGHTGGPYDTVPEVMIAFSFMQGPAKDKIVPIFFDEAGHRVATQYLMAVLEGNLPVEKLFHYREYLSPPARPPRARLHPRREVQQRTAGPHVAHGQRRGPGQPRQPGAHARQRRQPDGRQRRRSRPPVRQRKTST